MQNFNEESDPQNEYDIEEFIKEYETLANDVKYQLTFINNYNDFDFNHLNQTLTQMKNLQSFLSDYTNTNKMYINIIVAADNNNGIGYKNELLCRIKEDLKFFKELTSNNIVLMGKNTYDSIGKPLPNRINIVISKSTKEIEGCFVFDTIEKGIEFAKQNYRVQGNDYDKELYIIGGDSIYKQTINLADTIYLTRINNTFEADTFFPDIPNDFKLLKKDFPHVKDNEQSYSFQKYQK